jgi:ribosome-binding factor A
MSVRQERIQEQLVQELSEMIRRDLRDPRIGFVTLTGAGIARGQRIFELLHSVEGDLKPQTELAEPVAEVEGSHEVS